MCNHVATGAQERCKTRTDEAAGQYDLAPLLSEPSPPSDDALRLIIELRQAPARVTVKDVSSGQVLAELDEEQSREFLALDNEGVGAGASELVESLLSAMALREQTPQALEASSMPRDFSDQFASASLHPAKKTRSKLWELSHKLHCPVIGTCLDADELRKIARKANVTAPGPLSDYDVHVSFVSAANNKNVLSLAAQKTLEKKYAAHVRRFTKAKDTEQVTALWEDGLARGDVPGALWAALTHPKCDNDLKARLFEEVHMLSHQIGAGQRADLSRLAETELKLNRLQRDFDRLQSRSHQQLEDREKRINELEKRLGQSEQEKLALVQTCDALQQDLNDLRDNSHSQRVDELERDLSGNERELAQTQQERDQWMIACESAEKQICELEADFEEKQADCDALERFISQSLDPCGTCAHDDCTSRPNLQGQRILCVGGRQRLIEQYRELVARFNGEFEHHDGGLEHSRQRLESMLSSADAVVCATDCVSHDAYYRLKRFCKRHDKRHVFLRNSGISTFTRALYSVAE